MQYGHQQRGEGVAEEDGAWWGVSWVSGRNMQIHHSLFAACSSSRTGNLQAAASPGEELAAGWDTSVPRICCWMKTTAGIQGRNRTARGFK